MEERELGEGHTRKERGERDGSKQKGTKRGNGTDGQTASSFQNIYRVISIKQLRNTGDFKNVGDYPKLFAPILIKDNFPEENR
jgi:hypothetical protein